MGLIWQIKQFFKVFPEEHSWAYDYWMRKFNRMAEKKQDIKFSVTSVHPKHGRITLSMTIDGYTTAKQRKEALDVLGRAFETGIIFDPDTFIRGRNDISDVGQEVIWKDAPDSPIIGGEPKWIYPDEELQKLFDELDGRTVIGDNFFGEIPSNGSSIHNGNTDEYSEAGGGC